MPARGKERDREPAWVVRKKEGEERVAPQGEAQFPLLFSLPRP